MRGRSGARQRAWAGVAMAMAMAAGAGDAGACGLRMHAPTGPTAVREALHLAKSTREDDRREAVRVIVINADLDALDFNVFSGPSARRARMILVQLIVGSRGHVGPRRDAEDNLALAGRLLEVLDQPTYDADPRHRLWRALYHEVTGGLPPSLVQFELELLAGQQLMSHAAGWAAIARLRGPGELADEATERCWATSFDPERECAVDAPAS